MKHALWMTGIAVGLVACSGTYVGGDSTSHGGASAGGSGGGTSVSGAGGDGLSGASNYAGAVSWLDTVPTCTSTIDAWLAFDADLQDAMAGPGVGGGTFVAPNRDIYLIRPDGTRLTRLTTDQAIDHEPAFSPDGSSLLFTSNRESPEDIYIINMASHAIAKVTHAGGAQASFSPDGTLIAFTKFNESVYTIRPDGSEETLIGNGRSAHFIGNDQLAFGQDTRIVVAQLNGGSLRTVLGATQAADVRSVSPHGDELAYVGVCDPIDTTTIWAAPVTGSTQACSGRRLAPLGDVLTFDDWAAWGPENTIAYVGVGIAAPGQGRSRIALSGPDLSRCAITSVDLNSSSPTWSPVGWQP